MPNAQFTSTFVGDELGCILEHSDVNCKAGNHMSHRI